MAWRFGLVTTISKSSLAALAIISVGSLDEFRPFEEIHNPPFRHRSNHWNWQKSTWPRRFCLDRQVPGRFHELCHQSPKGFGSGLNLWCCLSLTYCWLRWLCGKRFLGKWTTLLSFSKLECFGTSKRTSRTSCNFPIFSGVTVGSLALRLEYLSSRVLLTIRRHKMALKSNIWLDLHTSQYMYTHIHMYCTRI